MELKNIEITLFIGASAFIGILALIRFVTLETIDMTLGVIEQWEKIKQRAARLKIGRTHV